MEATWVHYDPYSMTTPHRLVIQDARPGAYHLISRCVRRAFLCGDVAEHRRAWLEQVIKSQVQAFSIDVLTFAVMSNHGAGDWGREIWAILIRDDCPELCAPSGLSRRAD